MKKLGIIGAIVIGFAIALAMLQAGKMGQTSQAYARGRVILADELKDPARDLKTLFIIASPLDMPMPLGALRKTVSEPSGVIYEFVLTNESMRRMQENQPFPAEFKLKARLDRDGLAGPDQPGDLVGEVKPVKLGAEGVEIRIDRMIFN